MDGVSATRVALLDGFTLSLSGAPPGTTVEDMPQGVQRLVARVSLSRKSTRMTLAGELWPDVPEQHAHGSLRSALWLTRKLAPGLLTVASGTLSLAPDVVVDVRELVQWARRVSDPAAAADIADTGNLEAGCELLPGWYEDWVLVERERLRQLRMHALEALADKLVRAGRYGDAVQAAYAAVRVEPLRESAHRALISIHLAEGNVAEAVRAYESFRALLADEIGAAPTSRMTGLVQGLPRHRQPGQLSPPGPAAPPGPVPLPRGGDRRPGRRTASRPVSSRAPGAG